MAAKATKEKAPVETPVTPSEAHEEPLAEVKEVTETGETESGDSEPLTEVKEDATREAGLDDSEPPAEAKEKTSEETPAAPAYDYEVLPLSLDGATEEQIAMAKRVLDQNADIQAIYIVGGLYLSEDWRAYELTRNGERKVTVRRIIKKKGS